MKNKKRLYLHVVVCISKIRILSPAWRWSHCKRWLHGIYCRPAYFCHWDWFSNWSLLHQLFFSKVHGHRRWLIGQIGRNKSVQNSDSEWLLLNCLQNKTLESCIVKNFDSKQDGLLIKGQNQNWVVFPTRLMTVHIDHSYWLKRSIIFILDHFDENDRSI